MAKQSISDEDEKYSYYKNWREFSCFKVLSYTLMFASVPLLAYGDITYSTDIIKIIILTVVTLYSGFFAALIWNDINDTEIDSIVHPNRPIPSGKISKKRFFSIALIFSIITFLFSYLINIWCFLIVSFGALFVAIHNRYLKKKVKVPAYSEIFTPLQWLIVPIFGYIAISNSNLINMSILVLFTYFADAAHDLLEGIHDYEGDKKFKIKTYSTSFGIKNAGKISFLMVIISGLFAVYLYLQTILTPIFIILFTIVFLYTLSRVISFLRLRDQNIKNHSMQTGQTIYKYLLFTYDLIFIDIIIQWLLTSFNISLF